MNLKPKGLEGGEVREVFSGTIHSGLAPVKNTSLLYKQGRKRPLDTPKRMIERREREGEREKER